MTDQRRDDVRQDGASASKRGSCLMENLISGLRFYTQPESRAAYAAGFFGRDGIVDDLEAYLGNCYREMQEEAEEEANADAATIRGAFDDLTSDMNLVLDDEEENLRVDLNDELAEIGLDQEPHESLGDWVVTTIDELVNNLVENLRTRFHELAKEGDLE